MYRFCERISWRNWKSDTGRNHEGESLQRLQGGRLLERELRENRPAPPVRGWHYTGFSHRTTDVPGERLDRRVVRFGGHALRTGTLPVREQRIDRQPDKFPGRLYRRRSRPDPRLVLHATRYRNHGVRFRGIQEYHIQRTGAWCQGKQDVQTFGQCRWSFRHDRETRVRSPALVHDHELSTMG